MGKGGMRRCKEGKSERDLISQLSDDILFKIISNLVLKESVRTSIFSRRWEKLWRLSLGSNLVLRTDEQLNKESQGRFVAWVDRLLKSSRKKIVNEFVIHFHPYHPLPDALKSWLVFALENNVQKLDLNLIRKCYRFCLRFPDLRKCSPSPPVNIYLKDVRLCSFRIDEDAFHYFLSKCPNLEHLSLNTIDGLRHLNVVGQALKCLEVHGYNFSSDFKLFISAPNLLSLQYDGSMNDVELRSAPLLSKLMVGGFCAESLVKEIISVFGLANQLTTLRLNILALQMIGESMSYPQTLETPFPVLKHLEFYMVTEECYSLLWPISLIKAAPVLHTFKLETWRWIEVNCGKPPGSVTTYEEAPKWNLDEVCTRKRKSEVHKCLKVVEFHSFTGFKNQWQFVTEIVGIAQSLESVVLVVNFGKVVFPMDPFLRDVKTTAKRIIEPITKLTVRNSSQWA